MTPVQLPEVPRSYGDHVVYDSVRVMREPGYTAAQLREYATEAVRLNDLAGQLLTQWLIERGVELDDGFDENDMIAALNDYEAAILTPSETNSGR